MTRGISEAILRMKPDAQVSVSGVDIDNCNIEWHDGNPTGITKDQIKVLRPGWDCRQVSQNSLDQIEGRVRNMVKQMIESHPTLGKTFKL